jgi:Cdc6-like AAA superfamily ATPase
MASGKRVDVALVSQVEQLASDALEPVAAALQRQVREHFAPHWGIEASVSVFRTVTDVPSGCWPITIAHEINTPGAAGIHLDRDGVPFALVRYEEGNWTVPASHQLLSMLADPFGNRLIGAPSPKEDQDGVEVLVEVCDPCQALSYEVDGVVVSDFVTPAYYTGEGDVLDHRRAIGRRLELLQGGYLSWHDPETDHWWQQLWFDDAPMFRDLGVFDGTTRAGDEAGEAMPATPKRPRRKAADAKRASAPPATAERPEAERPPKPPEPPVEGLPGAVNDQVARVDQLGFRDYVIAFADLIESRDTEPPITIGIYGAWGTGKSFLLEHIEEELREREKVAAGDPVTDRPRVHVVRFNAWEYSSSEAIWPSLVRKIVICASDEIRWPFPGRFLRKLWRNLLWELLQERGKVLGALVASALMLALVLWQFDFAAGALAASAAALGVAGLLKVVADTISSPLSRWMTAVLTNGEYGEPIAHMNRIQSDLEQLSDRLAAEDRPGRFVVMIDDLDRCEPDKLVEVLQAINLLLNFKSFIVCLGIDARVVTRAIESHYGGFLEQTGASGYEYLDKIVQIPFRIPRPNSREIETFVSRQLRQEAVNDEDGARAAPGAAPPPPLAPRPPGAGPGPAALVQAPGAAAGDRRRHRGAFENEEIEAFERLAAVLEPNPRHLKRLINVYRLVRSLAGVRHLERSVARDPEGVILLLTIAAQWPYTAAAMLEQVDAIVEEGDRDGTWPEGDPLTHLHAQVHVDPTVQLELDRDPQQLRKLLARTGGHLRWKELDSLRRYVVNFNPAVDERLRRARLVRQAETTTAAARNGDAAAPEGSQSEPRPSAADPATAAASATRERTPRSPGRRSG